MRKQMQNKYIMKKLIQVFAVLALAGLNGAFAGTPAENTAVNSFSYSSPDNEVSFNIERGKGEVKINIMLMHLSNYDHIIIEKSNETMDNFGKCKYISCSELKQTGNVATCALTDNYPYTCTKDVYYRIKTVSKDGIARAYAPLLLPPLK